MANQLSSKEVTEINQKFYDIVADSYDNIDSRRNNLIQFDWLSKLLQSYQSQLSQFDPPLKCLDAGAGTGLLTSHARPYFQDITLLDISQKMLDKIDIPNVKKIVGDCNQMPFDNDSFHFIGAFATLHHLYDPCDFFKDAFRVLKPGGILYTDHDIELKFVSNFNLPLKIYRYFFDHGKKYLSSSKELTLQDYETTEFHGQDGLDAEKYRNYLQKLGFSQVEVQYHWEGMGFAATIPSFKFLRPFFFRKRLAPIFRIKAIK